jgi:4-amino-4-deoxy-L-arabinose transferase-like glycosyltransferase
MPSTTDASALPQTPLGWFPYLWRVVLFPASPDSQTMPRLCSILWVVLLPAFFLYPTLSYKLLEPDEGRYAQIPKEMHDRSEWVVPTLQGEPYLDKPPLMYWLVKLSYMAFGVCEASARLVPAICVHLTILAVYFLGRRSIGEQAAFWAAMLLSISPGFISVARILLLDGLLTMCVTLSVLCGFEAVRTGQLRRGWWMLSALYSGLGFLTKGPIAEVLLFPPLLMFALLSQSSTRVGWKNLLLFAGIVIGVNAPWYAMIYQREPAFLKYFFWEHNVMRFVQPFDHLQPVWFYVPIIVGGFFPGVVLGALYVRELLWPRETHLTRSQAGGFWMLAGLWCVFFFSCSGSKLPTYILPAYPFLALALGEFLAQTRWQASKFVKVLFVLAGVVVAGVHHVGLPWYAERRSPMNQTELVTPYLNDPTIKVVTYPRNVDSVAFYTNRSDFDRVRSKDVNQFIVDCHFRPKTVILFTHNHSYRAFKDSLPAGVRVTEHTCFRHKDSLGTLLDKFSGRSPWGLCDIAVIEPVENRSTAGR